MTERAIELSAREIRDGLVRLLGEAAHALGADDTSDEVIHSTRKKLKSARARLRLLREALGAAAYARENAALRDAARPLGSVRDAKVMLDTVDVLLSAKGTRSRRVVLAALRGRLQQQHAGERAEFSSAKRAAITATELERASKRIGGLRVPKRGAAALEAGVKRIYRSARRALKAVDSEGSPDNLHELRKQVKYLRQALTPYEDAGSRNAKKVAERADAIGEALGEDHDLHVLHTHIAQVEASTKVHSESFQDEVARRRRVLSKKAVESSRKLLRRKPRAFAKRLSRA